MGANEFAKARAVIDEAAKKWPDSALLANARGLVQLGLKDFHGALGSFRQAVRLAPAVPLYSLNLARGHLVNRDLDGALGVLDRLLRAEPGNLPALQLAAVATFAIPCTWQRNQ